MEEILIKLESLKSLYIRGFSGIFPKSEAAVYLGVSESYLTKISSRKKIPFYKPEGRLCYYRREDLDAYLLRNRVSTKEELQDKADSFVNSRRKGGRR